MPTPLLNVRLPEDEAAALTQLAEAQGRTRSDLLRELIRAALALPTDSYKVGAPRP
jgi:predicted DNA-binding protein